MRDAAKTGHLEADWIAELDALGMIWDKHDAALARPPRRRRPPPPRPRPPRRPRHHPRRRLARRSDWRLPHGADWHRKYHLLRAQLASALTRDTQLGGGEDRFLAAPPARHLAGPPPGQQQLMTTLGLTPDRNPLAPVHRARRTFEQTVQLLELFLHGDTVKIGAWLAKARNRHRSGQLPDHHVRLVAAQRK